MAKDYGRLQRLMRIVTLIHGQRGRTIAELAETCEVTSRTMFRDINILRMSGIPIIYDEDSKRYFIGRLFYMPPVQLTLDESLALIGLAGHLAKDAQIPFLAPAKLAIEKIRGQLPTNILDQVETLDNHVEFKLGPSTDDEQHNSVYERVRQSMQTRRELLCEYDSPKADAKGSQTFEFRPYALFFCQRAWYVVGYHALRKDIRTLKLARFTKVELSDRAYSIPTNFSLKDHLGNAWRMIRGRETYNVELHFDAQFADNIADTLWHPTQEVEWNEDGSIIFRCTVDGLDEIVWWVLSMGPHCLVKAPGELAERVKELAEQTAGRYGATKAGKEEGESTRLSLP